MTIPTTGHDARTRQFTTIMADAAARAMRHVQAQDRLDEIRSIAFTSTRTAARYSSTRTCSCGV